MYRRNFSYNILLLSTAAALQYQVDTRMFTQDQVQAIADILLKIFCAKHMKVDSNMSESNQSGSVLRGGQFIHTLLEMSYKISQDVQRACKSL